MKQSTITLVLPVLMMACNNAPKTTPQSPITAQSVETVEAQLTATHSIDNRALLRGVKQAARLWQPADGSNEEFIQFCTANFIANPEQKQAYFLRISDYLEAIWGHYNEMSLQLQRNVHEATGDLLPVDELFAAYSPSSHLSDDLYANKIAFSIILNFPKLSLEEKEGLGIDRLAWGYARLGDLFSSRIPAELLQNYAKANSDADVYIANYNIYAGHLLDKTGKKNFPEDMILLSHWNLRDEIKANYNKGDVGLVKQQTIHEAMKRIISQEIPTQVINSGDYDWNPYTNTITQAGKDVAVKSESTTRYATFLNNFKALHAIDAYTGDTYIDRHFSDDMEVSVSDAEAVLKEYLTAPELKKVGQIVAGRLGRDLEAFDIWYDGFKPRSNLDENALSKQTRALYPTAAALERDLPHILTKLGFTQKRAYYLADKIEVNAARGSGHAWGAQMKGQKAHLRTRIPVGGLDYKGYNIAIHEFGHNVEQTLSLYDVDYYLLNGVPNTAFTEALAFVFQKRDLELLGIKDTDPEKAKMDVLDKAWSLYEIAGVSMLDIEIWKWLYANPQATVEQLKSAVSRLSKEVWNAYFAPVFGRKDETILAIYSHTVSYPLYLSAYAFGQIIEFQLEQHFAQVGGQNVATEIDRIFRLGRLTPNQWIVQATGKPLSAKPLLEKINDVK
ncbi:hypothetical protein FACS1894199_11630 [Bacteroidia bacterium]|nr:hypothetical protein FACS1894199_11630 [Bacteroidia bacterium]